MPRSALEYVVPDHLLPAREIGGMLAGLVKTPREPGVEVEPGIRHLMEKEMHIAANGGAFQKGIMEIGKLTPFTCPECHGALVKLGEGKMSRFRCHTGHAYTDSALLEGVMQTTGAMLWQVIRSLEEAARGPHRVRLEYNRLRRWQDLSFSALRAFETVDGRISIHAR